MSRARRKMMKNRRRAAAVEEKKKEKVLDATAEEQQELQQLFENEQYADYINRLAEVIQEGHYDARIIYQGAYSYFMLGDYMRAANMINDVLTLMPDHVAARILLSRICLLDDRTDDGLAIIDFVLEHYQHRLSEEQRSDFKDLLDYYADTEAEHILTDFPHLAAFLQEAGMLPEKDDAEETEKPLKAVPGAEETEKPLEAVPGAEETEKPLEAVPGAEETEKPLEAVPGAKETEKPLEAVSEAEETEKPAEKIPEDKMMGENLSAETASAETGHSASAPDAGEEIRRIMNQPISLSDKVRLLNAFAAAHFAAGAAEYEAARSELEQACRLDSASQETLRNMAVLSKCEGKQDEAMTLASKLQQRDFLLLAYLLK